MKTEEARKKSDPVKDGPVWRGHAWVKGGNWRHDFSCAGYDELNKTVREMFEKNNAVEVCLWISM